MKEIRIGNTIGIIHSPLMELTKEERQEHFQKEYENGNPVLKELERLLYESYIKRMTNATKN